MTYRVRLAATARRDIEGILRWSLETFGVGALERYKILIDRSIRDIAADPLRMGFRPIDEVRQGYRAYPLRYSRLRVDGKPVVKPRHVLIYRMDGPDALVLARVLHDRMLIERHIGDDE